MNKILIIVADFYPEISNKSLYECQFILNKNGYTYTVISVPGSFEIPSAMNIILTANNKQQTTIYKGVIILGCVIQGVTNNANIIIRECVAMVHKIAIQYSIPLGFGLITAYDQNQAIDRAENYAIKAAKACLALIDIKNKNYSNQHDTNIC